jgi:hypothetical protein
MLNVIEKPRWKQRGFFVCVIVATVVSPGCRSSTTSSSTTFVPTIDPGMSVAAVVESSETRLTLTFVNDPAELRGGYYEIFDAEFSKMYLANTDANDQAPTTFYIGDDPTAEVLEYGVQGPGPEELIVPALPSGEYFICSANSGQPTCGEFTIKR